MAIIINLIMIIRKLKRDKAILKQELTYAIITAKHHESNTIKIIDLNTYKKQKKVKLNKVCDFEDVDADLKNWYGN
jgi:hypothetical protein